MEKFISCRVQTPRESTPNPFALYYCEVKENENGKRILIPSDCVKPSMASDFTVTNNAIYNNMAHGFMERISIDPVDMPDFIDKMLTE